MPIIFSTKVREKLAGKHRVSTKEVEECLRNRVGALLEDGREEHKSVPPTQWFIAQTNNKRELKIVFVRQGADVHIKSAFEPNEQEQRIYKKFAF
jgi:hypothetical protein